MKVLFAVSNEKISESIIKKYQQEYKEIISGKNVYYFNAITKELQKDKSYDRIVISEDLEPFANNNYEVIDKFIFEKLDRISDESTSGDGNDIPIILICADRRVKSENLLVKIFGIGIYSALIGQDRSVTNVCELINKPRSKKDAKIYYRIEADDVDYKSDTEENVSEIEIQNILNHYKKLGKNEDKYVDSFNNIAAQYTDAQLRVICKFLPLNVKAVLEMNSQKYQELITFGTVTPSISAQNKSKMHQGKNKPVKEKKLGGRKKSGNEQLDVIEKNIGKSDMKKSVVIPSSMDMSNIKKVGEEVIPPQTKEEVTLPQAEEEVTLPQAEEVVTLPQVEEVTLPQAEEEVTLPQVEEDVTLPQVEEEVTLPQVEEGVTLPQAEKETEEQPKKKRGRPKKVLTQEEIEAKELAAQQPKKKRGRPKKVQEVATDEEKESNNLLGGQEENVGGIILPGFEEEPSPEPIKQQINVNNSISTQQPVREEPQPQSQPQTQSQMSYTYAKDLEEQNSYYNDASINNLLTGNQKIVSFVGTSKNGTSFLVNNLAELLSKKGIKTAILDLTKNKNAYYIYTKNEEILRKTAFECIKNLRHGVAEGIQVNKNLTVYTTLPDETEDFRDCQNILSTLVKNYSLVLMDCDFDTDYRYFDNSQEIYLVQSYDILTIQPLTAFLRDLKAKNILVPEKLRIVLNKVLKVRSVTEKTIVGGIAYYNDPAMSFMTELFNKDTIKYCTIPFEEQIYSRYLEGLVNCQISINGYSKNFMMNLDKLSNMVYPLLTNNKQSKKLNSYNSGYKT